VRLLLQLCGDARVAPQAVLQHVRYDAPGPGRDDGGRRAAHQALLRLSCPRYCSEEFQRADWVSRHSGECAEARRARQAAGRTKVRAVAGREGSDGRSSDGRQLLGRGSQGWAGVEW
jgi:hypothetical protein